eukprot:4995771-Amphidinium_carterae.2
MSTQRLLREHNLEDTLRMLHSNRAPTERLEGQRSSFVQDEPDSYADEHAFWGDWETEEGGNDSDGTTSEH